MGVMGNTPSTWVNGVGDISTVILSYWFLYICVWAIRSCFSTSIFDFLSDMEEEGGWIGLHWINGSVYDLDSYSKTIISGHIDEVLTLPHYYLSL